MKRLLFTLIILIFLTLFGYSCVQFGGESPQEKEVRSDLELSVSPDSGLVFDGDGDYVDCGAAELNLEQWTMEFLVRPDIAGEGGPNRGIAAKAEEGVGWSWQLRYNSPNGFMGFQFNTTEGAFWLDVGQDLQPGELYYIVSTFDGTTSRCFLQGIETISTPLAMLNS